MRQAVAVAFPTSVDGVISLIITFKKLGYLATENLLSTTEKWKSSIDIEQRAIRFCRLCEGGGSQQAGGRQGGRQAG